MNITGLERLKMHTHPRELRKKHYQVQLTINSLNEKGLNEFTISQQSDVHLMKNLVGAGGKLGTDTVKGSISTLAKHKI